MKVLKERKSSFLLKRGLFVLSIFALAFAFGACGNGGTTYIEVPGPEIPGPPVEVPVEGPYVTRVTLLNLTDIEARFNWQGLPPNISGAVLDVEWSDGARRPVVIGEGEWGNPAMWGTFPEAVDVPRLGLYGEAFQIVHRSNAQARSAAFRLDNVVPLSRLIPVAPPDLTWFADQRPDFVDGVTITGEWPHWVFPAGHTRAGQPVPFADHTASPSDLFVWATRTDFIPFSVGYPLLDFTGVYTVPRRIEVRVGDRTPTPQAGELHVGHINIGRFLEPTEVRFVSANPAGWFLRDDHFRGALFNDSTPAPGREEITLGESRMITVLLNLLDTNDAVFEIRYPGGLQRTITWDEFRANRQWHDRITGGDPTGSLPETNPADMIIGLGQRLTNQPLGGWENGILVTSGDLPTWTFSIEYVGPMAGADTHRIRVDPVVPVYSFVDFATNPVRRVGFHENLQIVQASPGDWPQSISDVGGLLNGLNERWELWGTYARGPNERDLRMTFVAEMFDNINFPGPATHGAVNTMVPRTAWWTGTRQGVPGGARVASIEFEPMTIAQIAEQTHGFPAWPMDHWGAAAPASPHLTVLRDHTLDIHWRHGTSILGTDSVRINVLSSQHQPRLGYVTGFRIMLPSFADLEAPAGATLPTGVSGPQTTAAELITTLNTNLTGSGTWAPMHNWPEGLSLTTVTVNAGNTGSDPRVILVFQASGTCQGFSESIRPGVIPTSGADIVFMPGTNLGDWNVPTTGRRVFAQNTPGRAGGTLTVHMYQPVP